MSKTKKILLLLSTIISVSISAVSIYYLSLYYKLDQPNYVNLSDEEEKQLIYLKNSFNEFIFKKFKIILINIKKNISWVLIELIKIL
ncbi:hypothetical protein NV230_00595 [Mesomycoplasma hyorhinis]|uniref:hypothetical protein n=1 Tax=Mesomycoplasma hyorhinis TaxID=2100 RepID=UPI00220000D4|nr:hypothetical protein NV230_00595 [Mesomycoplasma hyorhinis]